MATDHSQSQSKPRAKQRSDRGATGSGARTFFEELQNRGKEPILKGDTGTLRFDLSRGSRLEHWYVIVSDGNVTVSHRRGRADTVVRVDGDLFDQMAQGTANAMTAQLRGALIVEGDLHLLMVFQRLFPGPPRWLDGHPPPPTRKERAHQ